MKIGVLMDPIHTINIKKDSTFAMLLEANRRNMQIYYFEQQDIFVEKNSPKANSSIIKVKDDPNDWFEVISKQTIELGSLDVILMRKDPPFDIEYIMDTYLLELAEQQGAFIVNKPQALRDANEKFFTELFPSTTPECVISRNPKVLRQFIKTHKEIIVKPMDGMGGNSIFKTGKNDQNLNVILESVTKNGTRTSMAQKFIPEINTGDKRILLIDGEPVPYCLARMPSNEDFRGNLAKGGRGQAQPLSKDDYDICKIVGPELKKRGIIFAGIDVIGNKLTEINVTSPTCIRELDEAYDLNIASQLFDVIESKLI